MLGVQFDYSLSFALLGERIVPHPIKLCVSIIVVLISMQHFVLGSRVHLATEMGQLVILLGVIIHLKNKWRVDLLTVQLIPVYFIEEAVLLDVCGFNPRLRVLIQKLHQ